MLGDAVEALLNQDPTQASALYLVSREMTAASEQGRRHSARPSRPARWRRTWAWP